MAGRVSPTPGSAGFAATQWTVVLAAAQERSAGSDAADAAAAMATLCQTYWYPLYAYVRRSGHDAHAAEDLTQEFFARLLSKDYLASVDRRKGKFRSFLLASLKHFLANEWDRAKALKRGGGQRVLSLNAGDAESRFATISSESLSPEKGFDRQWAVTVLNQALERLQAEYAGDAAAVFQALKGFLTETETSRPYAVVARELDMTEAAIKSAVHRLRKRYRQLLRIQIAQTVASADEVEEEIRQLFEAFQG